MPGPPPGDAEPHSRGRIWKAATSEEFNRSTEKATTTPIASSSASRGTAFDLSMPNRPASQKTNGVSSAHVYICWNASATGTVGEITLNAGSRCVGQPVCRGEHREHRPEREHAEQLGAAHPLGMSVAFGVVAHAFILSRRGSAQQLDVLQLHLRAHEPHRGFSVRFYLVPRAWYPHLPSSSRSCG